MSAISVDLLPVPAIRPIDVSRQHPLADTLARIGRLGGWARAGLGLAGRPLDDWTLATELTDVPSSTLERSLHRVAVHSATADRLVMTSRFFGSYVWQLATASLGCYLATRRIPDVSAENVAVHIGDDGRVDEIRFLGGGFAVLAGDPASDHPDAVVVSDLTALRELLVRRLTTHHLEELILALQAYRGLGTRALWAAVEDRCLGAMLWLANGLELAADAEHEAEALSRTAPFVGSSRVEAVEHELGRALTLKRGFCCLAYRLDDHGPCKTCPLRSTAQGGRRAPACPSR